MKLPISTSLSSARAGARSADDERDRRLMAEVRSGDTGPLEELFRRHHRSLFGFLRRTTGSQELAEDLTQEAFLRVLRYRRSFDAGRSFRPWLFGIARNLLIDRAGERRPQPATEIETATATDRAASPERAFEARQTLTRVEGALVRLSTEQREALLLARFQDLSYREIGEILDCSEGAVKGRVFRALQAIATHLESEME